MSIERKRVHVIVDFQHLYYTGKFMIERPYRPLPKLNCDVMLEGKIQNHDMGYLYYPIKDIESFRAEFEKYGHEVTVSVCFDSKPDRGEEDATYKAKREHKLTADDSENIRLIEVILKDIGYNIYKEAGLESDDLVSSLAVKYRDDFDVTVIYTNDNDLAANVNPKVAVRCRRAKKGYHTIKTSNYSSILGAEYGCSIPYNSIMLYKCTAGDISDNIKGIHGFGPKSFNGYIEWLGLAVPGIDFKRMNEKEYVADILEKSAAKLGRDKVVQAMQALEMVAFRFSDVAFPDKIPSKEDRNRVYSELKMMSLVE